MDACSEPLQHAVMGVLAHIKRLDYSFGQFLVRVKCPSRRVDVYRARSACAAGTDWNRAFDFRRIRGFV